jgi:PPK2 family polyphosphate:nucleotide phosphotransferase
MWRIWQELRRRIGRREEQGMDYRKEFRVDPHSKVKLGKLDPAYKGKHESPDEAKQEIDGYLQKLFKQQALLYAEHKHSILVVLQALDAGGKDGTIKHVFTALNPQGATVANFKQPTATELAHDFLWRIHPHAPGKGEIVIFNRSHYEDVLVTRVHKLIDKDVWTERYERIRDFEALLAESGTLIIKFFLHISKEEQLTRFAQRLDDPNRNWKISESDYSERALWDDYIAAFEDAIGATSTKHAPWYVIPSNHKWFRNLAVSQIMADTMEDLKLAFPPPAVNLADIRRKYHSALKQEKDNNKKKG